MKVKWELTGNDPADLKANVGDNDMLRVERLGRGIWWFAVYIGKDTYMSGELFPHVGTKDCAKMMAEAIYSLIRKFDAASVRAIPPSGETPPSLNIH